jgi:hypothetical protein
MAQLTGRREAAMDDIDDDRPLGSARMSQPAFTGPRYPQAC